MIKQLTYILFHKPYGVLCQFTDTEGKTTLAAYGPFPNDVYPAGRLDADSEGLILLTNDGTLQHVLLEPRYKHPRTYLAQIERMPTEESLAKLRAGVLIEGRTTLPADVRMILPDPRVPQRSVPIRFRKNIPTTWLEITLHEGRNRQVRKMTAAIGHPTLRLIRTSIDSLKLGNLQPGEHRTLYQDEILSLNQLLHR